MTGAPSIVLLAGGLLLFDTLAMAALTKYARGDPWTWLALAIALEAVAFWFLIRGIQSRNLTTINALWDIGSLVLVTGVGVLIFRDKLAPRHWLGLLLGALGIVLLIV